MLKDSVAQFQSSLERRLECNARIAQQLEQARAELTELGNPYAWPQRDWVEDHLRHLAIQRYHALRGEIAAIERQLNREVAR